MNKLEVLLDTLKACENQGVKIKNLEILLACNNPSLRSLVSNLRSLGYCIIHSKIEKSYKLITNKRIINDYCRNEIEKHLSIIKRYQAMLKKANLVSQHISINVDWDLLLSYLSDLKEDYDNKTIAAVEDIILNKIEF